MTTFPENEVTIAGTGFERLLDPGFRRAVVDQFHYLYYHETQRTWFNTYWMGLLVTKCPLDLWIYQEMLFELRPDVIIECGTYHGGSAFYLGSICDLLGAGRVYSVDIKEWRELPVHPRVEFIRGSSTSPEVLDDLRQRIHPDERVLVILDSDHTKRHVLDELESYAPFVTTGSYMIVEDTNINGNPALPSFGPGPMEAVTEFLSKRGDFEVDEAREKFFLTFNPRGYLRRVNDRPDAGGQRDEELEIIRRNSVGFSTDDRSAARPDLWRLGSHIVDDNVRQHAATFTGSNQDVLLLDCGKDALAAMLAANGNRIVGIEEDRSAARLTSEFCEEILVTKLDGHAWDVALGKRRFDVIVATDLIDRLENPEECLRRLRRFLRSDGFILLSLRNGAHGGARLAALAGDESITASPLPSGRRRVFTRRGIDELIEASGYAPRSVHRIDLPFDEGSARYEAALVPEGVIDWLSADEDARTYIFVVTAAPVRHTDDNILRHLRGLRAENDRLREEIRLIVANPSDSSDQAGVVTRLRAALLQLHRHFARREGVVQELESRGFSLLTETKWLRDQVRAMDAAITAFNETLQTKDADIAALNEFVHRKNEDVIRSFASFESAIRDKDDEIQNLALESANGDLHNEIIQINGLVDRLRETVRTQTSALIGRQAIEAELKAIKTDRDAIAAERMAVAADLDKIHRSKLWRFAGLYWRIRSAFRRLAS